MECLKCKKFRTDPLDKDWISEYGECFSCEKYRNEAEEEMAYMEECQ